MANKQGQFHYQKRIDADVLTGASMMLRATRCIHFIYLFGATHHDLRSDSLAYLVPLRGRGGMG